MKRIVISMVACAALAGTSLTSLSAKPIEEKNLANGKEQIDPAKGYIFVSGPDRQAGRFFRMPTEADYSVYRADREEALAKAKEDYIKDLDRWERRAEARRERGDEIPEKPQEPTEENFSIGPIELRTMIEYGPQFVFSKDGGKNKYSYLIEVEPGDYVYYGPVAFDQQQGMVGTCYCLGTVSFEVRAGEITAIGNALTAAPKPPADWPETATPKPYVISGTWSGARVVTEYGQASVDQSVPASLGEYPVRPADFRAYGKLDNFYGLTVTRIPPIDGVIAYERDRPIDLKAQSEMEAMADEMEEAADEVTEPEPIPETTATDTIAEDIEGDRDDPGPE